MTIVTRALTVTGAALSATLIAFMIQIELPPHTEDEIAPIKSSRADYAGFLGAMALILMDVLTGRLP